MKIFSDGKLACRIEADNTFSYTISWYLTAEADGSDGDLMALHRAAGDWAGDIGAEFRVPDGDGRPTTLPDVVVEQLEINAVDENCCEVKFSGRRAADGEALPTGLTDERTRDGEHRRSAVFRVNCGNPAPLFPAVGDPVDWAGEEFVCEAITMENLGGDDWRVAVRAFRAAFRVAKAPTVRRDADGRESVTITYFVAAADYAAFMADHTVDSPAEWAGADYAIRAVGSEEAGIPGYLVTLSAGKIVTGMVECIRNESFAGFDRDGAPRREIVYHSRWRVHADDLADFQFIAGAGAAWADVNAVITRVAPKQLSPLEHELEIEAQDFDNPDIFRRYAGDDRTNLGSRIDLAASLCDFLVTPEMAGYLPSAKDHVENPQWEPDRSCPFLVSKQLEKNMINQIVKTVLITEVRHRSGDLARNLKYLVNWGKNGRIYSGSVGGVSGSFLKIDLDSAEVYDNRGREWTRFTAKYQMAPNSLSWNPQYWRGK